MLQLNVKGMTCGHCIRAVTNAVREVVPDAEVNVSLEDGKVTVTSPRDIPADRIASAIADEGYEVSPIVT
ncbi:heavy-metal-associated domain-containing protein [Acidocella sp.]|uniref:heavy-metal-associated domain-containing protein n=1 Tax=Acidocella sp. TaxID=50710 RepID=UPI002632DC96|nr:cation transporter [Acidocella sp.]